MLWTVLSAQPCTLPRIGANQHHRQASEYQAGNKQPLGPTPLVLEAAHTQPLHKAERQGQATIQRSSQPQRPTGRDILLYEQPFRLLSRPRVANAGAHLFTLFADERHSSRRRGRSTRCSPESESAG